MKPHMAGTQAVQKTSAFLELSSALGPGTIPNVKCHCQILGTPYSGEMVHRRLKLNPHLTSHHRMQIPTHYHNQPAQLNDAVYSCDRHLNGDLLNWLLRTCVVHCGEKLLLLWWLPRLQVQESQRPHYGHLFSTPWACSTVTPCDTQIQTPDPHLPN